MFLVYLSQQLSIQLTKDIKKQNSKIICNGLNLFLMITRIHDFLKSRQPLCYNNGYRIYVDIMIWEKLSQFRHQLLVSLFIQQEERVQDKGVDWIGGGINILASCEYPFIVHENLAQHPSNYISIFLWTLLEKKNIIRTKQKGYSIMNIKLTSSLTMPYSVSVFLMWYR